jgi:hypothetical protein
MNLNYDPLARNVDAVNFGFFDIQVQFKFEFCACDRVIGQ